jgi:hypothetical protein
MSITNETPKTIILSGPAPTIVGDLVCSEALTPGHLVERVSSSGTKWRKHATAAGIAQAAFALNQPYLNKDLDTASAASDLVDVGIFTKGAVVNAILASGQTIALNDFLESAGDGTLRKYGSGVRLGVAIEAVTTVNSTARLRTEIV